MSGAIAPFLVPVWGSSAAARGGAAASDARNGTDAAQVRSAAGYAGEGLPAPPSVRTLHPMIAPTCTNATKPECGERSRSSASFSFASTMPGGHRLRRSIVDEGGRLVRRGVPCLSSALTTSNPGVRGHRREISRRLLHVVCRHTLREAPHVFRFVRIGCITHATLELLKLPDKVVLRQTCNSGRFQVCPYRSACGRRSTDAPSPPRGDFGTGGCSRPETVSTGLVVLAISAPS